MLINKRNIRLVRQRLFFHNDNIKCRRRFERLTRSPNSNDYRKLLTKDKFSVAVPSNHKPIFPRTYNMLLELTINISLTQLRFTPCSKKPIPATASSSNTDLSTENTHNLLTPIFDLSRESKRFSRRSQFY